MKATRPFVEAAIAAANLSTRSPNPAHVRERLESMTASWSGRVAA
jgi:hypothetical protein